MTHKTKAQIGVQALLDCGDEMTGKQLAAAMGVDSKYVATWMAPVAQLLNRRPRYRPEAEGTGDDSRMCYSIPVARKAAALEFVSKPRPAGPAPGSPASKPKAQSVPRPAAPSALAVGDVREIAPAHRTVQQSLTVGRIDTSPGAMSITGDGTLRLGAITIAPGDVRRLGQFLDATRAVWGDARSTA